MRFTLEIELGNDGMSTSSHLAAALNTVAKRIRANDYVRSIDSGDEVTRGVMDVNGNSVGSWTLKGDER
jgi:hypothetical protein